MGLTEDQTIKRLKQQLLTFLYFLFRRSFSSGKTEFMSGKSKITSEKEGQQSKAGQELFEYTPVETTGYKVEEAGSLLVLGNGQFTTSIFQGCRSKAGDLVLPVCE